MKRKIVNYIAVRQIVEIMLRQSNRKLKVLKIEEIKVDVVVINTIIRRLEGTY